MKRYRWEEPNPLSYQQEYNSCQKNHTHKRYMVMFLLHLLFVWMMPNFSFYIGVGVGVFVGVTVGVGVGVVGVRVGVGVGVFVGVCVGVGVSGTQVSI